jgi:hypothetical protein
VVFFLSDDDFELLITLKMTPKQSKFCGSFIFSLIKFSVIVWQEII